MFLYVDDCGKSFLKFIGKKGFQLRSYLIFHQGLCSIKQYYLVKFFYQKALKLVRINDHVKFRLNQYQSYHQAIKLVKPEQEDSNC